MGLVACAFKHNEQNRWNESKQQQKSMPFFYKTGKHLMWVYYPGMLCQDTCEAVIDGDKIMNMRIIIDRITEGYMQRVST